MGGVCRIQTFFDFYIFFIFTRPLIKYFIGLLSFCIFKLCGTLPRCQKNIDKCAHLMRL